MPEQRIGSRHEWQAAWDELAGLEADHAERNEEIKSKRLDLPWVRVEKEYEFDSEDGSMTLADLFDGRSQLLAYNICFIGCYLRRLVTRAQHHHPLPGPAPAPGAEPLVSVTSSASSTAASGPARASGRSPGASLRLPAEAPVLCWKA